MSRDKIDWAPVGALTGVGGVIATIVIAVVQGQGSDAPTDTATIRTPTPTATATTGTPAPLTSSTPPSPDPSTASETPPIDSIVSFTVEPDEDHHPQIAPNTFSVDGPSIAFYFLFELRGQHGPIEDGCTVSWQVLDRADGDDLVESGHESCARGFGAAALPAGSYRVAASVFRSTTQETAAATYDFTIVQE